MSGTVSRPMIDSGESAVDDIAGLRDWVRALSGRFQPRQVLLLNGPMGVGKTQLVKLLASVHGMEEASSPTFALHNQYRGPHNQMDHLDLYRIENEDELESIGFWDLFSQPRSWIAIEWAERVESGQIPFSWPLCVIDLAQVPGKPEARSIRWRLLGSL